LTCRQRGYVSGHYTDISESSKVIWNNNIASIASNASELTTGWSSNIDVTPIVVDEIIG
jgi:hypothetical protein